MQFLFDIISIPMGYILKGLSYLVGNNFAAAVFLFTVLVNLLMLPLTLKSQKSTVQQTRIRPKLDALKEKCGDDKQKYSMEMQALYQREGVSMSGGCMPLIIRMLLMMGIYYAVVNPLRYICGVPADVIKSAMTELSLTREIELVPLVAKGAVESIDPSYAELIDFNFLGINLTDTPHFTLDFSKAELIWIIPFMSFAAQMISSIVSLKIQKKANPDAPNMAGMMLTMPLISLFIGFSFPGALGFYWAVSAIIGGVIQTVISLKFGPDILIAKEQTKSVYKRFKYEKNRTQAADIN